MTMLFNIAISGRGYILEPIYATPLVSLYPTWFWIVFGVLGYTYPMLGLYLEGARKSLSYYITYPITD